MSNVKYKISNITFDYSNYPDSGTIEFEYTKDYANNKCDSAWLQLPDTPDSMHEINIEEHDYDYDAEKEHDDIFEQLREYMYSKFDDTDSAKCSLLAGEEIGYTVEIFSKNTGVKSPYIIVAIPKWSNEIYLFIESNYSDYFNVRILEKFDDSYLDEEELEEIIAAAKDSYLTQTKD